MPKNIQRLLFDPNRSNDFGQQFACTEDLTLLTFFSIGKLRRSQFDQPLLARKLLFNFAVLGLILISVLLSSPPANNIKRCPEILIRLTAADTQRLRGRRIFNRLVSPISLDNSDNILLKKRRFGITSRPSFGLSAPEYSELFSDQNSVPLAPFLQNAMNFGIQKYGIAYRDFTCLQTSLCFSDPRLTRVMLDRHDMLNRFFVPVHPSRIRWGDLIITNRMSFDFHFMVYLADNLVLSKLGWGPIQIQSENSLLNGSSFEVFRADRSTFDFSDPNLFQFQPRKRNKNQNLPLF